MPIVAGRGHPGSTIVVLALNSPILRERLGVRVFAAR